MLGSIDPHLATAHRQPRFDRRGSLSSSPSNSLNPPGTRTASAQLIAVHPERVGHRLPGQAAALLEPAQALAEVARQERSPGVSSIVAKGPLLCID